MNPEPSPAGPPAPPADAAARRVRRGVLVLFLLALVVGAGWRYRVSRTEYRFARGQEAIRAGDAETVRLYADRLAAAGASDHAFLLRGEALLQFGSHARALGQLSQVRQDGPLGLRAATLAGRCHLALGEVREAHRLFSHVVEQQPDDVDAHRGLAVIAYDLGQLGDAVDHLERVAALDPADARPHRLIGLIYKDMTQDEPSEAAYREALRRGLPPEVEREARAELAEVLARRGRFAEGHEVLAGVESPAAAAPRAECLRGLGRPAEAATVLDAALRQKPDAALFRLRGQVHQDQGQPAEALRCFERAVELAPADYRAQYLLGPAYAAAGRGADADRTFARVEQLRLDLDRLTALTREAMNNPWDPAVRLSLAELCERLGKPELAAVWRKAAASCSKPPGAP